MTAKQHVIFDAELIGKNKPIFLVCVEVIETGERHAFWWHKKGHLDALDRMLANPRYTWVGFNSENFDRPLIAAALMGHDPKALKEIAQTMIDERMRSWQTYREFNIDFVEYDHIDLFETAPGVQISLKTYMGRMAHKSLIDMPFEHDHDLTPKEMKVVEGYCYNDIAGTKELLKRLRDEVTLRKEMSEIYNIDLRSKSDAQVAEAILKKQVGIKKRESDIPSFVRYTTPSFIKTRNKQLKEIIAALDEHKFTINKANGSPYVPDFLEEPIQFGFGTYQMGVGGLHSTHDTKMYLEASDDLILSDFDVASYYPNIMIVAGAIPRLGGNKGLRFLEEYKTIYKARMEAKRSGNKKVANSLKICLNGTFGKLGSIFCSFYSPDLLLAVTITGQLNLLCLIAELEKIKGVQVRSANTDGIMVAYPPSVRQQVLDVISANAKRTGFEYEETQYFKYAAKDVNNYIAVKARFDKAKKVWLKESDGVKTKGIYASSRPEENPLYLMKNPTMEVCSQMVQAYLLTGELPEKSIKRFKNMADFVEIRNVKGGGVQHKKFIKVDDWQEVKPGFWSYPGQTTKPVKRKSRPEPRELGVGGTPFGRVARWYMTTESLPPITYVGSGNKVAGTEGAKLCMMLPDKLPADLNLDWYIQEAYRMLSDMGVKK